VLDASIVVEFILPFVLREAVRRAWKQPNTPQSLIRAHEIEVVNGIGLLPAGVEEEFAKSFEIGVKVSELLESDDGPSVPAHLTGTTESDVAILLAWEAANDGSNLEFDVEGLGLWTLYEHYGDFVRETDDLLPRFCVRNSRLFVSQDGGVPDETIMILYGVTVPQVPTNPDAQIPAPESIMDDCMQQVANVLKGAAPLSAIGVTKEAMKKAA